MRALITEEIKEVSAGFHINLGAFVAAIVLGAVTGGPVGVGLALSGIVMSEGVNNLNDLAHGRKP